MVKENPNKIKRFFLLDDIGLYQILEEDQNPPIFYSPYKVLQMIKWLFRLAVLGVVVTILSLYPALTNSVGELDLLFQAVSNSSYGMWIIMGLLFLLATTLQCFLYFFGLRALGSILGILMEMEFNSRGGSQLKS